MLDKKNAKSSFKIMYYFQMLKAGTQSAKWPKMKTEQPVSVASSSSRHAGSDDSDNEDKIPVPEFQRSFGSAIEAALENIGSKNGKQFELFPLESVSLPFNRYRIRSNYRTYPYKRIFIRLQPVYFCLLLYKGICCGYSFELHRLVDAVQMSSLNICLYKENQEKKIA